MPPNQPVPVYHHGRKFYVTSDEYERIRTEKQSHRRQPTQKPSNSPTTKPTSLPVRASSLALPATSNQRTVPNPIEQRPGILRVPVNRRQESARPSRSILKVPDERDDSSSLVSFASKNTPVETGRSNSSDRILEHRKTPLIDGALGSIESSKPEEMKRASSAEILQPASSSSNRRTISTHVADYGLSPLSTFSMTPTDQTYSQSNASKLTSYFVQMKPSSLDPVSNSNANSFVESGVVGDDHLYTVIGSSNRRSNTHVNDENASILTRSRDGANGSFSDESATSLSMLVQRRNRETQRSRRADHSLDSSMSPNQSKETWTDSSIRSQFMDNSYEKKRVRFADMEGFTLETPLTKSLQRTPSVCNTLLTRRKQNQVSNSMRGQSRPVFNAFYQAIAGVSGGYNRRSKLLTDV